MPLENESQPYEYFCENIPSVIERHFSENIPEEHKQMMGSIIRKYISHEDNWENYLEYLQEINPTTDAQKPEEINFSDEEVELLAREYADANKAVGNSINKIYLDDLRGGSTTGDKLLDGLMYGIYGGPNFDAALSIHDSKIGKRMKEYMG